MLFPLITTCLFLLVPIWSYDYRLELPPPCNPNFDPNCLAQNQALASTMFVPFTVPSSAFRNASTPSGISYCDNGAKLTLSNRLDNPSIVSNFYLLYGKVEVDLKAAPGQGVVSSFYLQSDDLDEIDIVEVFGGDVYEFQSNFFIKGNTSNYARGGYHHTPVAPQSEFIRYGMEWTAQAMTWYMDGMPVRVVSRNNPHGYPSSPMFVKFSLWAGGDPANLPGTIDWAGGVTDYTQAPFSMYVKNLHVQDYSTGTKYVYGNDKDGNWVNLWVQNMDKDPEMDSKMEEFGPKKSQVGSDEAGESASTSFRESERHFTTETGSSIISSNFPRFTTSASQNVAKNSEKFVQDTRSTSLVSETDHITPNGTSPTHSLLTLFYTFVAEIVLMMVCL